MKAWWSGYDGAEPTPRAVAAVDVLTRARAPLSRQQCGNYKSVSANGTDHMVSAFSPH
jgi:hypothetical protein